MAFLNLVFPGWYSADAVTIVIAIFCAAITSAVRMYRFISTDRRKIIVDLLNGSVLYPFFLLIISVGNEDIFKYVGNSKLSVALAGIVGIVFVAGELILSCSPDKAPPSAQQPQSQTSRQASP